MNFFIILSWHYHYAFGQLPGWILTKDRDGNSYYIDARGKIWTSGIPEFTYKAVSPNGLEYYLNHGLQLIKNHYIAEGINILNSILSLPPLNQDIYSAQSIASKEINRIKKREGQRFKKHIEKYPILFYKINNEVCIQNQIIPYVIKIEATTTILHISNRKKHNYQYQGLMAGLLFTSHISEEKKYEALLAIDSEQFKSIFSSVDELINHWQFSMGQDVFARKLILKEKHKMINEIHHNAHPHFTGFEGFFINGHNGHIVRIIFSPSIYEENKKKCFNILKNIQF